MSDVDEREPRVVYWAGKQWCVTDYGLETISPDDYEVPAAELGERTIGVDEPMAERLRHIADKTWVDIEDLAAAFAIAIQVHAGKFYPLPPEALLNALASARYGKTENSIFEGVASKQSGSSVSGAMNLGETAAVMDQVEEVMAAKYAGPSAFRAIPDPAVG